jgi:hypothetical protein
MARAALHATPPGPDAEALDPPELRAMITATVRALAARYTPTPSQLHRHPHTPGTVIHDPPP